MWNNLSRIANGGFVLSVALFLGSSSMLWAYRKIRKIILRQSVPFRKRLRVTRTCLKYLDAWKNLSFNFNDFEVKPIGGGLTNELYLCSLKANSQKEMVPSKYHHVLVRIYGRGSEVFFPRDKEIAIALALSERKLTPEIFSIFDDGRIEEYIPSVTLTTSDLEDSETSKKIAFQLARLHCIQGIPVKENVTLFDKLRKWAREALQAAPSLETKFEEDQDENKFSILRNILECDLMHELDWMESFLSKVNSPIVFCHNDLQEGNLLKHVDTKELRVIDFEYSSYNYRGFDFANHFCEWACDYSFSKYPYFVINWDHYPSREAQENFFKHYLSAIGEEQKPETIDILCKEADYFTLASHMQWLLWGIIQEAKSEIEEFGFLEYAEARLRWYLKQKKKLIEEEEK